MTVDESSNDGQQEAKWLSLHNQSSFLDNNEVSADDGGDDRIFVHLLCVPKHSIMYTIQSPTRSVMCEIQLAWKLNISCFE